MQGAVAKVQEYVLLGVGEEIKYGGKRGHEINRLNNVSFWV